MSFIAKFSVRSVADFGTGKAVELGAFCENDLMLAYAPDHHDKLFTQYSPWGDMRVNASEHCEAFGKAGDEFGPASVFYIIAFSAEEVGEIDDIDTRAFPGASTFLKIRCKDVLHQAGNDRVVQFAIAEKQPHRGADGFAWKMACNNPLVNAQLVPGAIYWAAFYPADKFTVSTALAAAHGRKEQADAPAA